MPCSRQPLSTTTALSFSGVSTRLIGKLPRSTASPAGSSRTPVGNGEVKRGFLCADTDVHSSAENERASRQIRSENIDLVSCSVASFIRDFTYAFLPTNSVGLFCDFLPAPEVCKPLRALIRISPSHSRFFVHRVCQQQDGSAEKQRVEEIVQRNHVCGRSEEHRQVNPQHRQQNREPQRRGCYARFPIHEQADACDNQNHANKITQENSPGNPFGSEFLQRNSRCVCRVQQMLHPIEQRRNAHEESRKGGSYRDRLCGRRLSWPSAPRRHCESESAAAEGKLSQRQGPEKSVAWVRNDGRQVHYEYEDQQRHSDQRRCQPRLDENGNTERRAKKTKAH